MALHLYFRNTFALIFTAFLISTFVIQFAEAQDKSRCSASIPCYRGCCSASGDCGFTEEHCSKEKGCQSKCDSKAECGKYSGLPTKDCPIKTCCSKFGFCGTTDDFCGDGCEKNSDGEGCGPAKRPTCKENADVSTYQRRIGYYELFNVPNRKCDKVYPEDLEIGGLTHINLAFVNFGSDFKIIDADGELVARMAFLKTRYHGLRINIAVGGWAFNDPPTETFFSKMSSSIANRRTFINSVVDYIEKYGLDGVDIDWEYPTATDRGGTPEDTRNFNLLMAELRNAFDDKDPGWEISLTLPNSFWYLQHFDIENLQRHISYFNIMSYDLHGMWDKKNEFTGPYLKGHTNLTEIEMGLDLLWRNNIKPENVVLGFAFYGRSFTAKSTACTTPDGCEFSTSGIAGSCSNEGGILTYSEISSRNTSLDVQTYYDPVTTVKYNVFGGGSQWVSYDDEQSFFDKKKYLSKRCLSGFMIWAIDQDTQTYDAMHALMGDFAGMDGGLLDGKSAEALADAFGAYTGQNCFVTERCTDGTSGQKGKDQVCPSGTTSVSTAHSPLQAPGRKITGDCSKGWYRHICCPTKAMPKNCRWNGAPERNVIGCDGKCGDNQFKLNSDKSLTAEGGSCGYGERFLCCDSAEILDDCFWTGCDGPYMPYTLGECGKDGYEAVTYRFDDDKGRWCADSYGDNGSPLLDRFKSTYCCPKDKKPQKCNWSNNPLPEHFPGNILPYDPQIACLPRPCAKGQTKLTQAHHPPKSPQENPTHTGLSCEGLQPGPNQDPNFPYCCEPPSKYNKKWPVDPKHLFENYFTKEEDDVMWKYDNTYRNNNKDSKQSHPEAEDGEDAYGFVMLNGPDGALDNDFPVSQTIVRRDEIIKPHMKRSLFTTNQTVLDSVFEHVEESIYVYCNFPQDSPQCQKIWHKGAKDTIIRLPSHVGEGPFARVVSMELADSEYQLPQHHIKARSLDSNANPVYKVTFDYAFDRIERRDDEQVNMRIDFTNLLSYWDDITDEPVKRKRSEMANEHLPRDEWMKRVKRSKKKHDAITKNMKKRMMSTSTTDMSPSMAEGVGLQRRWWGTFKAWLEKLTKVENSNIGYLDMAIQRSILIFKATFGCPGETFSANMKMYLDAEVDMDATYAYYFSGTIVPFKVTDTYAYFGLEPSAYIGLRLVGNARLQATTGRKKLIDTLSYPGLAIKGIAAVGPTLDLYGEIRGVVTLKGEARAGARLNFGKSEVFWPQDDDAHKKYQELLGLETKTPERPDQDSIEPTFDAKVRVDAAIDVIVTPEANMGLKVGGGKAFGGRYLVNGQLVGYVNTTLQFAASFIDEFGGEPRYKYGVYLLYNMGFNAVASVLGFGNWALGARNVYNPSPKFTVFERSGIFHPPGKKRDIASIGSSASIQAPRKALLEGIRISEIKKRALPSSNQTSAISLGHLFVKRADDTDTDVEMPDQSFTSQLSCPPGDTGNVQLPAYKINCHVFRDHFQQNDVTGNNAVIRGICSNVQEHFTRWSIDSRVLTLDNTVEDRVTERRNQQCPGNWCENYNAQLNAHLGRYPQNRIRTSCDEFPFASTEEGGDFLSLIQQSGNVACTPTWQQTLQGNCNKILTKDGGMATNIGYLARRQGYPAPVGNDWWVSWQAGADNWLSDKRMVGEDRNVAEDQRPHQRLTEYPSLMPTLNTPYRNRAGRTSTFSWNFKRNFTFSLAYVNAHDDYAGWGASGGEWQHDAVRDGNQNTDQLDMQQIACVVNTFDQDEIFKLNFNGYCWRGNFHTTIVATSGLGQGEIQRYQRCHVEFENAHNARKRTIGEFHGWKVKGIKFIDEGPVIEVPSEGRPGPGLHPLPVEEDNRNIASSKSV